MRLVGGGDGSTVLVEINLPTVAHYPACSVALCVSLAPQIGSKVCSCIFPQESRPICTSYAHCFILSFNNRLRSVVRTEAVAFTQSAADERRCNP